MGRQNVDSLAPLRKRHWKYSLASSLTIGHTGAVEYLTVITDAFVRPGQRSPRDVKDEIVSRHQGLNFSNDSLMSLRTKQYRYWITSFRTIAHTGAVD